MLCMLYILYILCTIICAFGRFLIIKKLDCKFICLASSTASSFCYDCAELVLEHWKVFLIFFIYRNRVPITWDSSMRQLCFYV
jgi:hypothetical protein